MKKRAVLTICVFSIFAAASVARCEPESVSYTLSEAVELALKNNPGLAASGKEAEIEAFGIDRARAEKMPKLDFRSAVTRYRYPTPITPISGSPLEGAGFPEFDNTVSDIGVAFTLPLYRGGRLDREVKIARIRKLMAEDAFQLNRQELIFNVTSVFYKIGQLEKLLEANEASVRQLESHKRNVELFLKAGTVPMAELLKTEAELAHARQNALLARNGLESAYELLKTLMGIEDRRRKVYVVIEEPVDHKRSPGESEAKALSLRPDYRSILRRGDLAEERIRAAEGKRLPDIFLTGEYAERSGASLAFKENWNIALRLSLPLYDGGSIKAEVNRAMKEKEKVKEEERALRLEIFREIKDAALSIENSSKRIEVAEKAIETAKENLRIELLKYEVGSGTSTDVIDAQTALLRAEIDFFQAKFDKHIAIAFLRRAVGEDIYREEASR